MELKEVFDALYHRYLLRDIFGKVVPGGILFTSISLGMSELNTSKFILNNIPLIFWIILFGFAWIVGYALQYVGEKCHVLRTHPHGKDKQETRDTFFLKWQSFNICAIKEHETTHAERLVVIKEACGNTAIAIGCGLIIVLLSVVFKGIHLSYAIVFCFMFSLGLALALWQSHIIHIEYYGRFVENTLKYYGKWPSSNEGSIKP